MNTWRTPEHIVSLVHQVLGGPPDLDPATDVAANEAVGARHILTAEDDALSVTWPTGPYSVYLNPPGGKVGGRSRTALFWRRLMSYRDEGNLEHAVFALFNIEGLRTTQGHDTLCAMDFPICVPAKRIQWDHPGGGPGTSPRHANAFVYVPGTLDARQKFLSSFGTLGAVTVPR